MTQPSIFRRAPLPLALACCLLAIAPVARARQIDLSVALGSPLLLADQKQTAFLKIGLTGFKIEDAAQRAPLNLVIVLDKSGSMQGEKIAEARRAAEMVVERLSPDDIFSLVTYDSTVNVLVPATKVTDRGALLTQIASIQSGGSTALFGGVSKGAEELRKFLAEERINRVILLSDGLANVGPSSPADLEELGVSLGKQGITVTTIGLGLGYNEDLMSKLAMASDGRHHFAETARDLVGVFDTEMGEAAAVVAQDLHVEIDCAEGVRPVRIINRDGDITGQKTVVKLNRLFSERERYILMEVETPAHEAGESLEVARVRVKYRNMLTQTEDEVVGTAGARYTASAEEIKNNEDRDVMVAVVEQIAVERNIYANRLRDEGKVAEARKVLTLNGEYLTDNSFRYKSEKLKDYAGSNRKDAENLDDGKWVEQRKKMKDTQAYQLQQ